MILRQPRSTLTYTLFPYTTRFLSPYVAVRESFLFQHLALAAAAALVYQVAFLAGGDLPDYRSGLNWGGGDFAATVVAPLLAMPQLPAGVLPLDRKSTRLNSSH